MKIRMQEVLDNWEQRKKWNSVDLNDIEVVDKKGNIMEIPQIMIDEWKFTGLNNADFIMFSLYDSRG